MNPYYSYRNPGVEEIIRAVKVLKDANYTHSYFFAPYEATPQIYYLHDHYLGANMCGYPDLLLYVWYNFIIDIDLENEEFEWVKYSKENKLNEYRNLTKVFLNLGYFLSKNNKNKEISVEDIRAQVNNCHEEGQGYSLIGKHKHHDDKILETVEAPWVFSLEFELFQPKRSRHDTYYKPELHGRRLSNIMYFSLFKGLITPKMCESLSTGKVVKPSPHTKSPIEEQYLNFNASLNEKASQLLEDAESSKTEEVEGAHKDKSGQSNGVVERIDPFIAKLLTSDVFNEQSGTLSEDYLNTINF